MDIKSMAKSKRSHTQHHQPRKPHNPPKTSSTSATATTKDGGDKKKKQPIQPKPPSLPSNWDRYEDEHEDEIHDVPFFSSSDYSSQFNASKAKMGVDMTEVKPKSKGADFRDLIAQAKESRTYYSPSFDDKLPDFYQGVSPMLAARGKNLILQDRDDDFLMEDEAGGTQEAPFLTLDLEDLAEQLSKIDLAERLFIEPELIPPELRQDEHEADNQVPFRKPEGQKILRGDSFDELLALYLEEEQMAKTKDDADKYDKEFSSNLSSSHNSKADADVTKSLSNMGFLDAGVVHVNHTGEKDANSKLDDAEQVMEITKQDTKSKLEDLELRNEREKAQNVTEQNITLSAAEAELDLLLGSFNETKLFNAPVNEPGTSATSKAPVQHSLSRLVPAFPVTSSLDDELDDLLAVTSNSNIENGLSFPQSHQVSSSSFSEPKSKSLVLEDFDSWLDTI